MDDNINTLLEKAEKGDIEQILMVAEWYEDRKEYKKALYWVIKGALQKNDIAQYTIGYFFEYGLGVKKNEKIAIIWYEKSANQGILEAQNDLAYLFEKILILKK